MPCGPYQTCQSVSRQIVYAKRGDPRGEIAAPGKLFENILDKRGEESQEYCFQKKSSYGWWIRRHSGQTRDKTDDKSECCAKRE